MAIDLNTSFVLCIDDTACEDLERRKAYSVIPDADAQKSGYARVIDESGEDLSVSRELFCPARLAAARRAFSQLPDPS